MKRWQWIAGAGVAVVGLLLIAQCERRKSSEDVGKWKAIAQRLQQDSAEAAATVRRTDSVFSVDTIRLRSVLNRYVTRRDTVLRELTDTVRVREFVTLADSTIAACRVVVSSCEQRVTARDSLIGVLGQQRRADQRLAAAQLRRANPRILPYAEALVDPLDAKTAVVRAGAEIRLLGPIRASVALQYTTLSDHPLRALLGARWTF